jgi:hypothetical protein
LSTTDETGVKKAAFLLSLLKTTLFFFWRAAGLKADTFSDANHAAVRTDAAKENFIVLKEALLLECKKSNFF